MIDFHSHILPSVDDGSKSLEMTRQMLEASFRQGVKHIVATPHFYATNTTVEAFLQRRDAGWDSLREQTEPRVHLGAEVAYFPNMSRSDAMQQLQIDQTGLLLVEMPFEQWTDRVIADVCALQDRQGLTPVLAHVERYRHRTMFPRYKDQLRAAGVLFQCNGEAFLCSRTKGWALRQAKRGYVHFLGSDSHNMTTRCPNLGQAAEVLEKKLGTNWLLELEENSAYALGVVER